MTGGELQAKIEVSHNLDADTHPWRLRALFTVESDDGDRQVVHMAGADATDPENVALLAGTMRGALELLGIPVVD